MKNSINIIYTCYKAVFFSLVQGPALALFVGFAFLSFNNSLADSFLTEARMLVGNAPEGKVQSCIFKTPALNHSNVTFTPPSSVYPEPCISTILDASVWKNTVDSTIRTSYFFIVLLSLITWCFCNGVFNKIINRAANVLSSN